jgi:hypothetical protein
VLAELAFDVGARHFWLLVGATLTAAAANTAAMVIPWRDWLATRRGRLLLDLWCGGVIAFVALLVAGGGSNFTLLLFLAVPFIEDRKLVERAKGLLMSALHLSEQDAFRRLQLTAREHNLRLADVAARIVEQQDLLVPKRKPPATR